jgi:antitoxin ChpS
MPNDVQLKHALEMLRPLAVEQQLRWMSSLGTYLTLSARDAYPVEESQGDIAGLVGFNELLHQVFGRINTLNRGDEWTLESFLDALSERSLHYGTEWGLNWAIENSLRELSGETKPRPRYTLAELLAEADYAQPQPAEEREWVDAPAVGRELL